MQTNKICLLFLFFGLLVSCQPKEKFDWEIGLSAPKYYSSSPSVRFFYNNKIIHSASSNIGIQPGWGETSGGYASGSEPDEVPDSLHVEWLCGTDGYHYEGNFKLPREKMLQLFQNPVTDIDGTVRPYSLIIVGAAPGGNITVWMRAISVLTEIAKFKAENKGIWKENDEEFTAHRNEIKTSKEFVNSEYNIFHYLHGIPYSVWEKGEKKYDYDVGFASEDLANNNFHKAIAFYSKDGSEVMTNSQGNSLENLSNLSDFILNNNENNNKIPVQMYCQWISPDKLSWFESQVALPKNFQQQCDVFVKHSSKFRIVVFMEKYDFNKNLPYTYGQIWLVGKKDKEKIMRFKASKLNTKTTNFIGSKYSLPKGFKFPKWEGREKLIKPDVEFWQEE